MRRAILVGFALAALLLAIGLGLTSIRRTQEVEHQLRDAKARAEVLSQKAATYAWHLDRTLEMAATARDQAETAAAKAAEAAAGRSAAEDRTHSAEQSKVRAESEARESRQELAAIQERRQQELNRMQEALARIAATRRTASGLVIDLANDSFRFEFDKSDLLPENREFLSRIAGVLLVSNGYRLFIDGYTDDVGAEEYNHHLSERRAKSVADYLLKAGIDPDIVQIRGFGKSTPRAEGQTSDARRQNRRVEIVVVDSIVRFQDPPAQQGRS
jgi:outer membrane protein OmpA-like peptidoglycan-associated protein